MTLTPRHRHWLLGLSLALTLAATVQVSQDDPESALIELATPDRTPAPASAAPPSNPLPALALPRLNPAGQTAPPVSDLFARQQWLVTPPAPRPMAMTRPINSPPPVIAAAPMPMAPSAPPLPFRYMGKVRYGDQHWRYFLVHGNRVLTVKDGDIVDNTYQIEGVVDNRLMITYLPLALKQSLTIGERS